MQTPTTVAGGERTIGHWVTADGRYAVTSENRGELAVDVSAFPPEATVTTADEAAAQQLIEAVRSATSGIVSRQDAAAAGYEAFSEGHLVNQAHVDDGTVLDPARPEMLMFEGERLVAVMFLAADNRAPGPQVAGPLATWHYHPWKGPVCWRSNGLLPAEEDIELQSVQDPCPDGMVASDRSPEMLHVWLVDHPDGPFSSNMTAVHEHD